MELKVLRADPAGNITLFVLDPVPAGDRAGIAARLMDMPGGDVEQVGFLCPPLQGSAGRLEMAGGEFCGNATRAFGMLMAQQLDGLSRVQVEVSGCGQPVTAEVDGCPAIMVDLIGIAHLVVEDVPPSLDFFRKAEPLFWDIPDLDAYGVIFLDSAKGAITPLVKVPTADSLVWEGSCGSGSLAAAIAQSQNAPDGPFVRTYIQPAGAVEAAVLRRDGEEVSAWIGGSVSLDAPVTVQL